MEAGDIAGMVYWRIGKKALSKFDSTGVLRISLLLLHIKQTKPRMVMIFYAELKRLVTRLKRNNFC